MGKQDITGGTGITAGGDVNFGDVSGQVAIGDFINQFKIENPSGEALVELMDHLDKQRQEKFNTDILKCYSPSTLPKYPPKLREFVTHNRVEEIKDAIEYLQNYRILLISGIGGVGKTTLARGLIETRPANIPLPFWFDFSKNVDATLGDILEKLAGYMNTPDIAKFKDEKRDAGQDDINRLTDELEKESVWLVFDNFETILDGRCFHDPGLDLLFTSLRSNTHKTKIIVTSRTLPKLKNGESLIDVVEDEKSQDLKGLKSDSAIDYLKKNGLDDVERQKLEELTIGVDGHPLALMLLVKLVKKYGIKDTLNDLSMFQKSKEDTIKKARRLFEKLAGDEKELLERVSVFRKPESLDAIKSMFTDETSGDPIDKLLDKSLLETDHRGAYWLHPLVREFSYDDLKDKIEVHKRAYQYYLSLPLPETPMKKEDIQSLLEAHHHACMAEEYDKAVELIFNHHLNIYLSRWGNYKLLTELLLRVLPEDHFKDKMLLTASTTHDLVPQKQPGNDTFDSINEFYKKISALRMHGSVLQELGTTYSQLGQFEKAKHYHEQSLNIAKNIFDEEGEGSALGNLGRFYGHIGDVEKAIEYYKQALEISRKIDDKDMEVNSLGNIGMAFMKLGKVEKSIEYCKQALEIARETANRAGEAHALKNFGSIYYDLGKKEAIDWYEKALEIACEIGDLPLANTCLGNIGNIYSREGLLEKGIKYYEKGLKIARKIDNRSEEGTILRNLGRTYNDLGQVDKAIEYYEQALVILREIGDRRGEKTVLGNLGTAFHSMGQVEKAIKYYEQVLVITREIGDRQGEGQWLGNLGLAYSVLDQVEKAIEYHEQALEISREIGDRRSEGLELGSLGNAYYSLSQMDKAIKYHEQALEISREIGDKQSEGSLLGSLGRVYKNLGQVDKVIKYYEQALEISREIGDRPGERAELGNLGLAYSAQGQVDIAIEYYEQALEISRKIGDRQGEGAWLGNLGIAYTALGQMNIAIEYYEQALEISREIGDRQSEGAWLGNLGTAYGTLGQVDKTIEYHEQALEIAREIEDMPGQRAELGNLGFIYQTLGQVDIAIEYYEQALVIAREIGDRRSEGNHLNNLAFAFIDENKYREALACHLLAKGIRIEIKDPNIKITESSLDGLKDKLGEMEFEKLLAEVAPRAEEIITKILEESSK